MSPSPTTTSSTTSSTNSSTTRSLNRWNQITTLFEKQLLISRRSPISSALQIAVPAFFIILIVLMSVILANNALSGTLGQPLPNPTASKVSKLPRCTPPSSKSCTTLAIIPSHHQKATWIRDQLSTTQSIPLSEFAFFNSIDELETDLKQKPNHTMAAISIASNSTTRSFSYTIIFNNTVSCTGSLTQCINPYTDVVLPLQRAVDQILIQNVTESSNFHLGSSFAEFPRPGVLPPLFGIDLQSGSASKFLSAAVCFPALVQLFRLVEERENGLALVQALMGVKESSALISFLLSASIQNIIALLLVEALAFILQIEGFIANEFTVIFVPLFLFMELMSIIVIPLASCIKTTRGALTTGLVWWMIGVSLASFAILIPEDLDPILFAVLSLLGGFYPLGVIITETMEINRASGDTGIKWSEIYTHSDQTMTIGVCIEWIIWDIVIFGLLGWYLNAVMPKADGRLQLPPLFFLNKQYWIDGAEASSTAKVAHHATDDANLIDSTNHETQEVHDMRHHVQSGAADNDALVVKGLEIAFGSKNVLQGIWLSVSESCCLCLLGSNGAGKTTLINCLVGILQPTAGDATIFGHSIAGNVLQSMIGVCAQKDTLYPALTARDHLRIFAKLKGISHDLVDKEVDRLLNEVELEKQADLPAKAMSGGMRRRLTLASALIGDPQILLLDECTTGLDVRTRKKIWKLIQKAKQGKLTVLVTHSMEEANELADSIAVLHQGRLEAIGTALTLKKRYGENIISITLDEDSEQLRSAITEIINQHVNPINIKTFGNIVKVHIASTDKGKMPHLLEELEQVEGISHLGTGMSPLDSVFRKVIGQAKKEAK